MFAIQESEIEFDPDNKACTSWGLEGGASPGFPIKNCAFIVPSGS
jgi:hypothetical protein